MPFRPRKWEAAEAVYTENNRKRRGRAAGICWTLGWVVWSKEMKMLRHSHSGMKGVNAGNRKTRGLWAGRSWGLE